jgi:hypothetical protein
MPWPLSPDECPRCHYFEPIEPPIRDDAGYETVGLCHHPRIAMELFCFKHREQTGMEPCPLFRQRREVRL